MTNVLILAPKYPPETGGASVYFQQVVELLEGSEYDVTVFAPRHPEKPYKTKEHGAVIYRAFPPTGARVYAGLKDVDRFYWLLRRVDPDISHVHPHFPQYRWFRWLLKYHRIPRVYDCRDKSFSKRYVSDGSYYLSVSEDVDTLLSSMGINSGQIARAPVIMPEIKPAEMHLGDGYHVAFVGDVVEHKGVQIAADAVEQLTDEYDITLHIAGDGEQVPWLEQRLWKTHLHYHGQVPHDHAVGLIRAANVIVIPSQCEVSPRVAREALAVNTPAVATAAGDLPTIVGNAGEIVQRGAESVARGIERVISNDDYTKAVRDRTVTQSTAELRDSIDAAYSATLCS